jgi:hypothetical protein
VELVEGAHPAGAGAMNLFGPGQSIPRTAQHEEPYNRYARTGAKGEFEILNAKPGTYSLKISHPEYKEQIVRNIEVKAKEENKVGKFTLDRGGSLICTVYDIQGKPAPDQIVTIMGEGIQTAYFARTDANGAFQMSKMTPGTYTLSLPSKALPFGNPGHVPPEPQKVTVYVGEGEVAEATLYAR